MAAAFIKCITMATGGYVATATDIHRWRFSDGVIWRRYYQHLFLRGPSAKLWYLPLPRLFVKQYPVTSENARFSRCEVTQVELFHYTSKCCVHYSHWGKNINYWDVKDLSGIVLRLITLEHQDEVRHPFPTTWLNPTPKFNLVINYTANPLQQPRLFFLQIYYFSDTICNNKDAILCSNLWSIC